MKGATETSRQHRSHLITGIASVSYISYRRCEYLYPTARAWLGQFFLFLPSAARLPARGPVYIRARPDPVPDPLTHGPDPHHCATHHHHFRRNSPSHALAATAATGFFFFFCYFHFILRLVFLVWWGRQRGASASLHSLHLLVYTATLRRTTAPPHHLTTSHLTTAPPLTIPLHLCTSPPPHHSTSHLSLNCACSIFGDASPDPGSAARRTIPLFSRMLTVLACVCSLVL